MDLGETVGKILIFCIVPQQPGPGRRSRILNTLNEIWVFDLSLAIWSIRTNHLRGSSYGYLGVAVSAEALLDVSDGAARAGLDWNATRLGLLPAALATCRCAQGDGPRPLRA